MYLGIDLGTTNTVVARSFTDADNKLVTEVVQMGQYFNDNWEKYPTLPSMVLFGSDGLVVGREAKKQREWDSQRVITNSKRFMGTNRCWEIDGRKYEPRDIAAFVLQHCKKTIEREGNMSYETVVITVPASFNPDQIEDTLIAAKQAGFKDDQVIIKHEPTAALLSFIDSEIKKSEKYIDFTETKRIMVFDLGGGTCDTSIIDVKINGRELLFTEVGIGRYQELGGIDFDAKAAECLLNNFFKEKGIKEGDVDGEEKEALYQKLMYHAEGIKERLSGRIYNKLSLGEEIDLDNFTVKYNITDFYKNRPCQIEISKKQYDGYTKGLYAVSNVFYKKFEDMDKNKSVIEVIRKTLEDYSISKSSIDYVFVTGGMSQFITVREKIEAYVGKPVITPENPLEAVARGASMYQYYKVREEKSSKADGSGEGIIDTMMLAEAVLLDMNEGLPRVIIPRKTVVPYSAEIKGRFRTTSPSGIKLNIYAAEDEFDSSMRIQRTIEKSFIFPVMSGTPFDIKYTINENKAISMEIVVGDSKKQVLDVSIKSDIRIDEKNYDLVIGD